MEQIFEIGVKISNFRTVCIVYLVTKLRRNVLHYRFQFYSKTLFNEEARIAFVCLCHPIIVGNFGNCEKLFLGTSDFVFQFLFLCLLDMSGIPDIIYLVPQLS